MKIVKPITITPAKIVSSTAPISTRADWNAGTAYAINNEVYYDYFDWIALAASTGVAPGSDPTKWAAIAASNRYAMFDNVINNSTSATTTLDVRLTPGELFNFAAFFGVQANSIQVKVIDPVDGIIYDETRSLIETPFVVDWYSYFFEPISTITDMIFDNLPAYGNADIEVIMNGATGGTVSCGEMVTGVQRTLGVTNFNTSVSIQDYSRKERDQFGNISVVQRQYTKRADYDVTVETKSVNYVQTALAEIRTTPTVFIGDSNRPETVVFGFYKNFNIVLSTPSISDCTLEVEGLI